MLSQLQSTCRHGQLTSAPRPAPAILTPLLPTAPLYQARPQPCARPGRRFAAAAALTALVVPPQPAAALQQDELTPSQLAPAEALAAAAGAQRLVRVGRTQFGRGLVATSALDKNQCIVSVPIENALIICDTPLEGISVFSDACIERWQEHHGRMPQQLVEFLQGEARWDVRMTAWLLWVAAECTDSELWSRYLALLPPADEVTCLLNYTMLDAKELQFKELMEEAKAQYQWAQTVHRRHFDSETGDLRALRLAERQADTFWAMSMVRTRTFSETVNGEDLTLMVPYADLANHASTRTASFQMASDHKRFELRLVLPLKPGQEATISYGEYKPNFEMMRDYGFVLLGNPNDRATLPCQADLPHLNAASLLQAVGFTGDWRDSDVGPAPATWQRVKSQPDGRLQMARRRCALLSLALTDSLAPDAWSYDEPTPQPPAAASTSMPEASKAVDNGKAHTTSKGSSKSKAGGGMFDWLWTPAPDVAAHQQAQEAAAAAAARPLPLGRMASERRRVAAIVAAYQAELDRLPTSALEDFDLLLAAERGEVALTGLHAAAVRCRLQHKLLLGEVVKVMGEYDEWLQQQHPEGTATQQQQQLAHQRPEAVAAAR